MPQYYDIIDNRGCRHAAFTPRSRGADALSSIHWVTAHHHCLPCHCLPATVIELGELVVRQQWSSSSKRKHEDADKR